MIDVKEDKRVVKSLCGAVDLLAAIFGEDKDALRIKFDIPPSFPLCLRCKERVRNRRDKKRGYHYGCWQLSRHIQAVCSECGQSFELLQSDLIGRVKQNKTGQLFCSHRCFGSYAGRTYGFGVHHKRLEEKK